jgi:hypothetical protein
MFLAARSMPPSFCVGSVVLANLQRYRDRSLQRLLALSINPASPNAHRRLRVVFGCMIETETVVGRPRSH